jgi:serine/threonine-protein kinase
MSSEHAIAQALPEYDILGEVGAGAYGRVWWGRHRALDRAVAVKELLADATPAEAARFRGEARLLARIDYPHVVRVFDYRERAGVRLLVMELLTGGTLAERRTAGISVESAVGATIAAACGLQVVHEAGILHHDVKPENLLFDDQGTLKVADFGQARSDAIHATARDEPVLGALVGTPAYVSPEQAAWALGDPGSPVDARSDQYSLAATLFELVTGRLTHDATGGALALCERRAHQDPRSARSLRADLPHEIEAVLERALAPRPDDRYPDCGALARALAAAAHTLGAGWFERSEVRVREPSLALGGTGPPTGSATRPDVGSGETVVPLSGCDGTPTRSSPAGAPNRNAGSRPGSPWSPVTYRCGSSAVRRGWGSRRSCHGSPARSTTTVAPSSTAGASTTWARPTSRGSTCSPRSSPTRHAT